MREATERADRRTEYEVAVSWVKSFRNERGDTAPSSCFISYAWGDAGHVRWVEELADHLQQADIAVTLDKWHCRPGTDLGAFIERINGCEFVCAIGTPSYLEKYTAQDKDAVVRAELRLINARHMKSDKHHDTVIPLLRIGSQGTSFPPLLQTSVFVNMRDDPAFLSNLFDLLLTIHRIAPDEPMACQHSAAIADLDKR